MSNSVGDLRNSGLQGNNYPWQIKVLNGLQCICDELKAINVDTSAIEALLTDIDNTLTTNTSAYARTPNLLRATGAGSIAVSAFSVSVANVGNANGTVLGGIIKPGEILNFDAGALNNFYTSGTFAYDGTGTELVIIYNS
jgi:hypothetical protein